MELAGKEQEFRQQLTGDNLISGLISGQRINGAPAPAGGAVTTPTGGLRVSGTASPVDVVSADRNAQLAKTIKDAEQGRIKITDELLLVVSAAAPKKLPFLQEMRKSQEGEEKNRIAQAELDFKLKSEKRKTVPRGLRTEREMNADEYNKYEAARRQYLADGDENKLMAFYDDMGWLESEQVRNRKIPKAGEASTPISTARSSSEQKAEETAAETTAKGRAEASEKMASRLGLQAEAAFGNSKIADDMIAYAKNNPRILEAMNQPGIIGAIKRAAEEGIKVGNYSVSVPSKTLSEANLTAEDLTALQLFAQNYAELQTRGRQLNRTPGEGSTSDYETRLLGSIYALPTDSQRAVILKSDALKLQGRFDEARFKLWVEKRDLPGMNYDKFLVDDDYKELKSDYRKTLDRVREENMDILTPKKKDKKATAPATTTPAPTAPPKPAASTPAPVSATPLPSTDPSVPPTHIRDPKTGVIRRKREGE
jgi:hypothetical protein